MPLINIYDNANDGNWGEQQGGTWSSLRSLGTASGTAAGTSVEIASWNNTFAYTISRAVFSFNTSVLGAGAVITGVTLNLTAANTGGTANGTLNYITNFSGAVPVTTPGFSLANFSNSFGSAFGSIVGTGLVQNTVYQFSGGTDLIGYINKTGTTNLGLVTDQDFLNITPGTAGLPAGNTWYAFPQGTARSAFLTINYTSGAWIGKYGGA